jgi:hypothetical protein
MLWFKHQVLYAPSDFTNEENFMKHWVHSPRESTSIDVDDDVAGADVEPKGEITTAEVTDSSNVQASTGSTSESRSNRSRYLEIRQAEDLAIKKLSRELNLSFVRDVALQGVPGVRFDAIADSASGPVLVEVVRVFSSNRFIDVTRRAMIKVSSVVSGLPNELRRNAQLILVVVVDEVPENGVLAALDREVDQIPMSVAMKLQVLTYEAISRE